MRSIMMRRQLNMRRGRMMIVFETRVMTMILQARTFQSNLQWKEMTMVTLYQGDNLNYPQKDTQNTPSSAFPEAAGITLITIRQINQAQLQINQKNNQPYSLPPKQNDPLYSPPHLPHLRPSFSRLTFPPALPPRPPPMPRPRRSRLRPQLWPTAPFIFFSY